jgi:hypothetical protein
VCVRGWRRRECAAPLGLETKTALESWSVLMVT